MNAFLCEGRGWVLSCDEMNKMEFRGQYANIRYLEPHSPPAPSPRQRWTQHMSRAGEGILDLASEAPSVNTAWIIVD